VKNLNADTPDANILSQQEYDGIWQPMIKLINKKPSPKEKSMNNEIFLQQFLVLWINGWKKNQLVQLN